MLKIFYRPDKLDTIEANLVAEAANRLGVGEFQFFRLAHREWFDREVQAADLEPAFLGYMLHDQVPHYVRQYARNVIQRDDAGALDPEATEYHIFDHDRPAPRRRLFGAYQIAIVVIFTIVFMGLVMYTYTPVFLEGGSCLFPPCPHVQ